MSAPDLIIFDCDGVLVDSEPISVEVLLQALRDAGVSLDPSVGYRRFLGRSMATIADILRSEHGLAVTDAMLQSMRETLYARFRADLQPIPGVGAAIARLSTPFCVASSSQVERVRLSLEITGLFSHFGDRLFSATMVERGKPAPDLFLHAASSMGVDPRKCVVIEDSAAGITAARSAGMQVLAFVGGSHAEASGLRNAAAALTPDAIFDDFDELDRLLQESAAD